jgi:hypothetical protein
VQREPQHPAVALVTAVIHLHDDHLQISGKSFFLSGDVLRILRIPWGARRGFGFRVQADPDIPKSYNQRPKS